MGFLCRKGMSNQGRVEGTQHCDVWSDTILGLFEEEKYFIANIIHILY